MPTLLWDASALAKRYGPETGTGMVDLLFTLNTKSRMVCTVTGYAETYSILLRRHNRGDYSSAAFLTAKTALREEVLRGGHFDLLSVDDNIVFASLALMDKHNLNATDAAILTGYLRYAMSTGQPGSAFLLITSDHRLFRAAASEGFGVLDPEDTGGEALAALLAPKET